MPPIPVFRCLAMALVGVLTHSATLTYAQVKPAVDLALVLAVDCSGSVDPQEFQLQLDGIAQAFRDPEIVAAIQAGPHGKIAVNMLLWADPDEPKLTTGWRIIDSEQSAARFSSEARNFNIRIGGGTGLGVAIGYGLSLLSSTEFNATRKTIDVSGDGRESWELREPRFKLAQAKALRATKSVTVNGLAISNDDDELLAYYQENIIGGPGAFAMETKSYEDFADAMRIKLLREILPNLAMLERE